MSTPFFCVEAHYVPVMINRSLLFLEVKLIFEILCYAGIQSWQDNNGGLIGVPQIDNLGSFYQLVKWAFRVNDNETLYAAKLGINPFSSLEKHFTLCIL